MFARQRGFTLVEMIVATVILGVGLIGIISAFGTAVKTSADPMIRKQMLAIAEEMMEEVQLQPYGVGTGTIVGCDRSGADDIWDYQAGYSTTQPVCGLDGTAIGDLGSYAVSVTVVPSTALGLSATETARITVTVTHGGETVTLTGFRTNYAS